MFNKLNKFFSDSTPQKHAAVQNVQSTSHSGLGPEPLEVERMPDKNKTLGNVSLLKLCDQKLEKLSRFFALEEDASSGGGEPASETVGAPHTTDVDHPQSIPKASEVAENISLLQLCDQKLEKISKFFALEEDLLSREGGAPTETPDAVIPAVDNNQSNPKAFEVAENVSQLQMCDHETAAMEADDSVNAGLHQVDLVLPPESNIGNDISLNEISGQTLDISSELLVNSVETVAPVIEEGTDTGSVDFELSTISGKVLETSPDFITPIQDVHINVATNAIEPTRYRDSKIEEQLQLLEQLLEEHITKVKVAENDLSAFKDELRQQIFTHAHANEQQLLDNKITLEITLKSAIRKIIDRQTALEESYNEQSDLILQALGKNRENLIVTAGKLDDITEHLRQLTEDAQSLSNKIEKLQSDFELNAIATRVKTTEKAPKRKSWFK